MPVEWNDNFMPLLREEVVTPALNKSVIAAEGYARRNFVRLSVREVRRKRSRGGKRKGSIREIYGSSTPGGFPGTRSGNLRNHMTSAMADPKSPTLVASFGVYGGIKPRKKHRVVSKGTARGYGSYLQHGTKRMKARPYLTLTLAKAPISETFDKEARYRYAQTFGVGR